MTFAGTAAATVAAVLALVGLTGGFDSPTDVTGYDQPRSSTPPPPPVVTTPLWVGGTP